MKQARIRTFEHYFGDLGLAEVIVNRIDGVLARGIICPDPTQLREPHGEEVRQVTVNSYEDIVKILGDAVAQSQGSGDKDRAQYLNALKQHFDMQLGGTWFKLDQPYTSLAEAYLDPRRLDLTTQRELTEKERGTLARMLGMCLFDMPTPLSPLAPTVDQLMAYLLEERFDE